MEGRKWDGMDGGVGVTFEGQGCEGEKKRENVGEERGMGGRNKKIVPAPLLDTMKDSDREGPAISHPIKVFLLLRGVSSIRDVAGKPRTCHGCLRYELIAHSVIRDAGSARINHNRISS